MSNSTSKLDCNLDSDGHPIFALSTELMWRNDLVVLPDNTVHPLRALATSGKNLGSSTADFCSLLAKSLSDGSEDDDGFELTKSFQELVYRSAEWFETVNVIIDRNVSGLREPVLKSRFSLFSTVFKNHRRDWAVLCNRLKHNHDRLVSVRQDYSPSGHCVLGYSLQSLTGEQALAVNKDFHKGKEQCRSYLISVHQMMFDTFRLDREAANLVGGLPRGTIPFGTEVALRSGDQLRKLASLMVVSFSDDVPFFDRFSFNKSALGFSRARPFRPAETGRMGVFYEGDGMTRTFPIV